MSLAVLRGDARSLPLPDACVDLICCSPPYFGLRSYTDSVKCLKCIDLERDGRDPRQAWPDYDAHVRRDHVQHYEGQIGSEATPQEWLAALVECTAEWMRVLKPSGSLFVNLGDKYVADNRGSGVDVKRGAAKYAPAGPQGFLGRDMARQKSLMGLPWRYAIACTDQLGLILRRDIIWSKPNSLPESVTDRCRSSHEYVFHLVKQPRYYAAVDEIREPHTGTTSPQAPRTMRSGNGLTHRLGGTDGTTLNPLGKLPGSVWDIPSQPLTVPARLGIDHFAAFPMELPRRIILGWSPPGVCTACGEGRRPVVDKPGLLGGDNNTERLVNGRYIASGFNGGQTNWARRMAQPDHITGYACACPAPDAPTRPAVVADPFGGTGTTALVASMYGRLGLSFDMSADYCRLAAWRTTDPAQRAAAMQVPKPPPVPDGMEPLFATP